jgi:hypothetical protein
MSGWAKSRKPMIRSHESGIGITFSLARREQLKRIRRRRTQAIPLGMCATLVLFFI